LVVEADAAAGRDGGCLVVKRIVDIRQAAIRPARGGCRALRRVRRAVFTCWVAIDSIKGVDYKRVN
jgi:hypothetical protein